VDSTKPAAFDRDRRQIEAWIDEARAGSAAALGHLLEACRHELFAMARRRTAPLECKVSASDLVQETALDAHRDFASFRGACPEELLAWLRNILLYNAANARRRFEDTKKRALAREVPLEQYPQVAGALCHDALSPRSLLVASEEEQSVEQAIACLPPDYQRVILLRSREHLSFAEVGQQFGRSAEAVRKLWFRAVEQLQLQLATDEHA
jgi:RNA polymerase sigma-70 factor, ECF subfamily